MDSIKLFFVLKGRTLTSHIHSEGQEMNTLYCVNFLRFVFIHSSIERKKQSLKTLF